MSRKSHLDDSARTDDNAAATSATAPRVLKKYPNRRLYDTLSSSYITLADVKQMVLDHQHFEVRDAKSGEDLTRSILLQIILEEEAGGMPLFTVQTLSQMIRFYGHAMQGMMGAYLEQNMHLLAQMQQRFAEQSRGLYDPATAFNPEAWGQLMRGQPAAPAVPNLMGAYLEQSQAMLAQMQQQTQTLFGIKTPATPGKPKADDEPA